MVTLSSSAGPSFLFPRAVETLVQVTGESSAPKETPGLVDRAGDLEEECQSRVQWEKGREFERFSEVKKLEESVPATRVELRALEST